MPFRFTGEKENTHTDVPSEEFLRKLADKIIMELVHEVVQEVVNEQLYITQESGLRVCRLTGKIVDPETDRPRGEK